jgi:peptidoglycan/xylan/chitin deacetylase (PgdA/CDA1 family)
MSILKENSISAVFFISTPKKQFYWDLLLEKLILPKKILEKDFEVFNSILATLNQNIKIEQFLNEKSLKIIKTWKLPSTSFPFERCLAFSCITSMIETQDPFKDNSVYRKLNKINNIPKNFDYLLSKPELINYHSIGSHTSNHFNLNSLSPIQQKNQISKNKKKLEKYLKRRIRFFAYPYGSRTHYNKHSIELAKKYFKFTFSNFKGNVHKDSNHFEIPRFLVRDWNIDKFKVKLESFIANK